MPIAVWLLLLAAAANAQLLNIPHDITNQSITNFNTNDTFAYDLSMTTDKYVHVFLDFAINNHHGQPGPNFSSVGYLYAEVQLQSSGATSALKFDDIGSHRVDGNGFVMMKKQFVTVKIADITPPPSNMTVTVFLYYSEDSTQLDAQFNLTVKSDNETSCPNNCSKNGICSSDGVCECNTPNSGYDCSVTQTMIGLKGDSGIPLKPGDLAYAMIPASIMASSLFITIGRPANANCSIAFRMNSASTFGVMSIFEGQGRLLSGGFNSTSYTTNPFDGELFFVINNFGPEECQVTINVSEQSTVSILLIIMIVLGVAILIALIIGIIYIVRKRRMFRVQPR